MYYNFSLPAFAALFGCNSGHTPTEGYFRNRPPERSIIYRTDAHINFPYPFMHQSLYPVNPEKKNWINVTIPRNNVR